MTDVGRPYTNLVHFASHGGWREETVSVLQFSNRAERALPTGGRETRGMALPNCYAARPSAVHPARPILPIAPIALDGHQDAIAAAKRMSLSYRPAQRRMNRPTSCWRRRHKDVLAKTRHRIDPNCWLCSWRLVRISISEPLIRHSLCHVREHTALACRRQLEKFKRTRWPTSEPAAPL